MKKNILIFGSNSAILRCSIKKFLTEGYKIIGISKSNNNFKNIKNFTYLKFDIEKDELKELYLKLNKKFQIGNIIYAIGGSKGNKKILSPCKNWQEIWWYNFGYSIDINNFFLPIMNKKKYGRILYFSSTAVNSKLGTAIYSSTKAIIEDYVKKMGKNFAKNNVFFNAIKTSIVSDKTNNWFKFEKNKSGIEIKRTLKNNLAIEKFGRSDYFKDMIFYLNSEKNKFTTGSIVEIDGGFLK